jgi:hypothetical protein
VVGTPHPSLPHEVPEAPANLSLGHAELLRERRDGAEVDDGQRPPGVLEERLVDLPHAVVTVELARHPEGQRDQRVEPGLRARVGERLTVQAATSGPRVFQGAAAHSSGPASTSPHSAASARRWSSMASSNTACRCTGSSTRDEARWAPFAHRRSVSTYSAVLRCASSAQRDEDPSPPACFTPASDGFSLRFATFDQPFPVGCGIESARAERPD